MDKRNSIAANMTPEQRRLMKKNRAAFNADQAAFRKWAWAGFTAGAEVDDGRHSRASIEDVVSSKEEEEER